MKLTPAQWRMLAFLQKLGGREYMHSFHKELRAKGMRARVLTNLVARGAIQKEYVAGHGTDYVITAAGVEALKADG